MDAQKMAALASDPQKLAAMVQSAWFFPLFATPIFALEVAVCVFFCKRARLVSFILLVSLIVGATTFLSTPGTNKAVWTTANGFILHNALQPRALIPYTAVINVKAAALNPADYKVMNNLALIPYLRWVMYNAPTYDVSGIVVEVGPGCDYVKPGDSVFGHAAGGLQQFAVILCSDIGKVPKGVDFAQAAAATTVSYTALVGFRKFPDGGNILIVGASGGCGQAATLLAKARKASKIYCIASAKNRADVLARGCDVVYDYTSADFKSTIANELKGKIDLVYDTVSEPKDFPSFYVELLMPTMKENGVYETLTPSLDVFKGNNWKRMHTFLASPDRSEVDYLSAHPELFKGIKLTSMPGLDLENVKKAYDLLKSHRTNGKIVLTIN